MEYLTLPLQVDRNGLLASSDRWGAISDLISATARTPAGSCTYMPFFGIQDLLERYARTPADQIRPHQLRDITNSLNKTIEALTGGACKVTSVQPTPDAAVGSCLLQIALSWTDGAAGTVPLDGTGAAR